MKSFAFLAFVALAAAFDVSSYQPRQVGVTDGSIFVNSQGWNIVFQRPADYQNYLEIYVTGPSGFTRKVLINNQFQVVKDFYHNNDFAQYYQQGSGQSHGHVDFNQFEYLLPIFRPYVGALDVQQWSQLLSVVQKEVQIGKVHYLAYEFLKNFGSNEEFLYGRYSSQYSAPSQGQYFGNSQSAYARYFINKYFGKYNGQNQVSGTISPNNYYGSDYFNQYSGNNYYGKQYVPYNQQYYGPYSQQYYGSYPEQYYGPYNQQYYGSYPQQYYSPYSQQYYGPYSQQYSGPYNQQYSGPYNQQYYGQENYYPFNYAPYTSQYYGQQYQSGPYNSQFYGQQYQTGGYYPYSQNYGQQYYGQYHGYPQYHGNYYGQQYEQNYPSFLSQLVSAY